MRSEHLADPDQSTDPQAPAAPRPVSNTTLLGEIAWLMLRVDERRGWHIWDFARLVMPAIGLQQFRLYYDGTVPIAYASWAFLSAEAETRFLADANGLRPEDWASGDRAYFVDFVAQKGAVAKVAPLLRRDPLLRAHRIRAFKRRNGQLKLIEVTPGARRRPRISVGPAASADTGGTATISDKTAVAAVP
jgi:hemolysin-activating ACP:hemolysin acyltransferase